MRIIIIILALLFTIASSLVYSESHKDADLAFKKGDFEQTVKLLLPIAEKGSADTKFKLAGAYLKSGKTDKNYVEALNWFKKGLAQGNGDYEAIAEYAMGYMNEFGLGVERNLEEAFNWYFKSAQSGYSLAQYSVGKSYFYGIGSEVNYAKAFSWLEKSALQNNVESKSMIANMYYDGIGVLQDYNQAFKYAEESAKQGNENAQGILSHIYLTGNGAPKNYVLAHVWANMGAIKGDETSIKVRDFVMNKMTPKQLTIAKEVAKNCYESNYTNCN